MIMLKYVCLSVYLCFSFVYCQFGGYGGNRYHNYDYNYQEAYQNGYQTERTPRRNIFEIIPQTIRKVVNNRWNTGYNQNGYNYQNPNSYHTPHYLYYQNNPNYHNQNSIPNQYPNYNNQNPNFNNEYTNVNNQDFGNRNPDQIINTNNPTTDNQNSNFNNQNPNFNNQNIDFSTNNPGPNNQIPSFDNQNPTFINPNANFDNQNTNFNNQNPSFDNLNINNNDQSPNTNQDPNFDVRFTEQTTPKPATEEPYVFPDDDPVDVDKENDNSANSNNDVVHVVETAEEQVTPSTQPTEGVFVGGLIRLTPPPVTFEKRNMFFSDNRDSCKTVDNTDGQCISLLLCQQYVSLLQQGQTPSVVNVLRRAHCGFDGTTPKVCCPPRGFDTGIYPVTLPTTTEPVTPKPTPSARPKTNDDLYVDDLPEPPVCGASSGAFTRVVRGDPAKLGQFPWMALLGYRGRRDPNVPRWLCGGSLISSKHVLTAAHCIHGREDDLYQVRLGELDLANDTDGATPIDVPIIRKIKHEDYSPTAFSNDIGLLVLDRDVQFTTLIKPICIPRAAKYRSITFERYNPFIAGWGDTEFRGPAATHLQTAQLPVTSNAKCAKAYAAYKQQVIDHKVLCAGYDDGDKDACQGDSGGPLMSPLLEGDMHYFYQIGVVSFGKKCAEPGFPGVYSRVTYFVPWIEQNVVGRTSE